MDIIEPDYYARFRCIGSECEDTCCSGMGVVVDEPTYKKYQTVDDAVLTPLIRLSVIPNPQSNSPATFASIKLKNSTCPFLRPEMDCAIQSTLGEDYLSRTCDTYPRAYSKVDDVLERSLYFSCPEATRLILLRPGGIKFSAPGRGRSEKYSDFPTVETADGLYHDKPYLHMTLIRNFAINLLRNRSYPVWQRLVILGMYCDQLSRLPVDQLAEGAPALTESFAENLTAGNFSGTLIGIVPNPSLLLNVVVGSLEDRITSEYTSQRFLDCYQEFLQGIGYKDGIEMATLTKQFTFVQETYYRPFIEEREYIWENFLVAKAYRDLFPFGPQKSVYAQNRTIYQEYIVLSVQYLFARTLFVGQTGFLKNLVSEADVVLVVQSYARAVEHNLPYLAKILRSFEQGKIAPLPTLASLIKL